MLLAPCCWQHADRAWTLVSKATHTMTEVQGLTIVTAIEVAKCTIEYRLKGARMIDVEQVDGVGWLVYLSIGQVETMQIEPGTHIDKAAGCRRVQRLHAAIGRIEHIDVLSRVADDHERNQCAIGRPLDFLKAILSGTTIQRLKVR